QRPTASTPARSAAWKASRSPITRARSEPGGGRSIARRLRLPCRECQTSRLLAADDADLVTALDGRRLAAREHGCEELAEPPAAPPGSGRRPAWRPRPSTPTGPCARAPDGGS